MRAGAPRSWRTSSSPAGILLQLRSSLILQPIDGAVLAASIVTGRAFPTIKIANDVGCVIAAAAVGLVFLGNLYGIGAGTLVSAFAVGLLIKRVKPCSCPENSSEDVSLRSRMPQRIHEKTARLSNVRSGPFFFKGRRDPSQPLRIGIISPWATERS